MATYTMQLKTYIEQATQFDEGVSISEKIEAGRKKLFDFPYPIFDEDYRKQFETNIIRFFYTREIGSETEELFKFRLETWLNINMPYFNSLFESETWDYDPLQNSNVTKRYDLDNIRNRDTTRDLDRDTNTDDKSNTAGSDHTKSRSDSNRKEDVDFKQNTDQDNFQRGIHSDNPDSRLQLSTKDGEGVIEYASDIKETKDNKKEKQTGDSTSKTNQSDTGKVDSDYESDFTGNRKSNTNEGETSNRKDNDSEKYLEKRFGKVGVQSYPKLIMEYRQALLRVEVQIHKEMQELFMLVY